MILRLWLVVNRWGCRARAAARVASPSACWAGASRSGRRQCGVEADAGVAVAMAAAVDEDVHELLGVDREPNRSG